MHTWERLGKGMIRLKKREKEKDHALQRELLQQRLQKDPWAFRVYITLRTVVLLVMVIVINALSGWIAKKLTK